MKGQLFRPLKPLSCSFNPIYPLISAFVFSWCEERRGEKDRKESGIKAAKRERKKEGKEQ